MQVKFIGVPGEHHQTIHMYGQDFPLGQVVEVNNQLAIKKLQRHPHFMHKPVESTDVESRDLEQEFKALANAELEPIEAAHVAEAETQAALTDEDKYGNAASSGDSDSAEDQGAGRSGTAKRGRPRKSA
jgi:hypothetical protein